MAINNFNVGVGTTSQLTRYRYVATGGETSVSGADADGKTLSYTVGLEQVFLNGVNLVRGQDYTATNGTSVGSLTALVASDVVEVFAFVPFNIANALTVSTVDAKGDLLVGTGADAVGRLAVGTNGQLLSAASGETSGLKWANPSSLTSLETGSLTGASVTTGTLSGSYRYLYVVIKNLRPATDATNLRMRFNGDSNSRYNSTNNVGSTSVFDETSMGFTGNIDNGASTGLLHMVIPEYANTTTWKFADAVAIFNDSTTATTVGYRRGYGFYNQTSAITTLTFFMSSGNFTSGDYVVYGGN